jgi:hypothetical protein
VPKVYFSIFTIDQSEMGRGPGELILVYRYQVYANPGSS